MPLLKIMGFDGEVPRESPTMLGDSQAQTANNVKLYARELRYWRGPSVEEDLSSVANLETIYKYYNSGDPIWLAWASDVDVATSPSADVTDYRLYYTGDGTPKKTGLALTGATPTLPLAGADRLEMGVPAPADAPSVGIASTTNTTLTLDIDSSVAANDGATSDYTVPGPTTTHPTIAVTTTRTGSADRYVAAAPDVETRVYVYTNVSTFGSITEESAPSPASSELDVRHLDTVAVGSFTAAPAGAYNITARRIYRSVTGATSDTYLFVAEISIGTSGYTDTLTPAELGEALGTLGWSEPPATLTGLVSHPGGSLVGFSGNTVYFSEPYYPHAWPLAYAISLAYPIVGLGVYGSSVVALTERYPFILTGSTAGAISVERLPMVEPCVAKKSIASDEAGIIYASPNGLVGIGPASRGVMTRALFRRDEWQALSPDLLSGDILDGRYIGTYPTLPDNLPALVLSRDDIPALSFLDIEASASCVDNVSGSLFYVDPDDGKVYEADQDELNPTTYSWKSKRFVLPQATTFSVLKLDGNYAQVSDAAVYTAAYAAAVAANAALFASDLLGAFNTTAVDTYPVDGSTLQDMPVSATTRFAQVLLYGDEVLRATLSLTSFDPIRIPPFKSRVIEVEITGNIDVRSVALASAQPELRAGA